MSDYLAQVVRQRDELQQLLKAAEDELQERRGRERQEGRLHAAWQSTIIEARRQAARADAAEAGMERVVQAGHAVWRQLQQTEARLAELENEDEDEGDWMSGMLWARKLSILNVPLVSPAFTGDTTDPWETAAEAARQHELVAQRLADYLSADPVPGLDGVPRRAKVDRVSPVDLAITAAYQTAI